MLVLVVIVVSVYGALIESDLPDGTRLVDRMKFEMDSWGLPLIAILIVLPFIAGMSTGFAFGFVGACFPIVLNLTGDHPSLLTLLATSMLAFNAGYAGMMLSPVHVCLIVTNEYFSSKLTSCLVKLTLPVMMLILSATGYYLLLNSFH